MAKIQQNTKTKFNKKIPENVKKKKKVMKSIPNLKSSDKPADFPKRGGHKISGHTSIKGKHKGKDPVVKETPGISRDTSEKKEVTKEAGKEVQSKGDKGLVSNLAVPSFQKYNHCIVEKNMFWFEKMPDVPKVLSQSNPVTVGKIKEVAEKLWDNERSIHDSKFMADMSQDTKWLKTVMKSGTLSDKVAAFTMLLQESPVHSIKSLDALLGMAKKKGRRESLMAVDSLRHLWVTSLLPDRKLKYFHQWPLDSLKDMAKDGSKAAQDRLLVLLYFEDLLKCKYVEFVGAVERHLQDTVTDVRNKALGVTYELLVMKPEEEQRLLKLIVNKLGDPDRKVASRASFLLTELVSKHPNMKTVVAEEVERLLFRPNIKEKAQYYAICFLNQLILSTKEKQLASKLIAIYFAFFKVYAEKSKTESKMLSALLTGVNRAFPFAKDEDEKYQEQLNMLFRVCHVSKYSTSVQALMLLYQVMDVRQSVSDRFYQIIYEKILSSDAKSTSKQAMFLNLLFKSMSNDTSVNRVKAFVKRIFQSCTHEQQSYVCGALYLLSELLKRRPYVKTLLMQPEGDDDEEHFTDVILEEDRVTNTSETEAKESNSNEDKIETAPSETTPRHNHAATTSTDVKTTCYQINKRNPLFCGAQFSCAWEAFALSKHFHPSVQYFTKTILQGSHIQYEGDPLQDFTLMRFLDRFIYKNPKQKEKVRGRSSMQSHKLSSRLKEAPVNSSAFLNKGEENIREDEMFFYKYFQRKSTIEAGRKGKKTKKSMDIDELDNEVEADDDAIFDNLDFASEIKSKKKEKQQSKKKRKRRRSDASDESEVDESDIEEEGEDEEGEFDYDDMEFGDEDFSEEEIETKKKWTDQDYEKLLLENLTSDEEEMAEEPKKKKSKKEGNRDTSMFAAAEEFAHLLEDVRSYGKKMKEEEWESRNDGRGEKKKRNPPKRGHTSLKKKVQKKGANFKRRGNKH